MRSAHVSAKAKSAARFGIVAGRFNREISEQLVKGALAVLREKKIPGSRIDVRWVPGAFELPLTALSLARSGRYQAVVALGCILEGETAQYRYLSEAVMQGLVMASVLGEIPVASGVITAKNWKQAQVRSQGRQLHRGREAAKAALEMVKLLKSNSQGGQTPFKRGKAPSKKERSSTP